MAFLFSAGALLKSFAAVPAPPTHKTQTVTKYCPPDSVWRVLPERVSRRGLLGYGLTLKEHLKGSAQQMVSGESCGGLGVFPDVVRWTHGLKAFGNCLCAAFTQDFRPWPRIGPAVGLALAWQALWRPQRRQWSSCCKQLSTFYYLSPQPSLSDLDTRKGSQTHAQQSHESTPIALQEWPRQTKPKNGQFMNFSQGHSGTKVQCESCLFS